MWGPPSQSEWKPWGWLSGCDGRPGSAQADTIRGGRGEAPAPGCSVREAGEGTAIQHESPGRRGHRLPPPCPPQSAAAPPATSDPAGGLDRQQPCRPPPDLHLWLIARVPMRPQQHPNPPHVPTHTHLPTHMHVHTHAHTLLHTHGQTHMRVPKCTPAPHAFTCSATIGSGRRRNGTRGIGSEHLSWADSTASPDQHRCTSSSAINLKTTTPSKREGWTVVTGSQN